MRPRAFGIMCALEDRVATRDLTLEVHVPEAVPRLLGGLHERFDHVDAGVVHEDVDRARARRRCARPRRRPRRGPTRRAPTLMLGVSSDFAVSLRGFVVDVAHRDRRAEPGQSAGDGGADAATQHPSPWPRGRRASRQLLSAPRERAKVRWALLDVGVDALSEVGPALGRRHHRGRFCERLPRRAVPVGRDLCLDRRHRDRRAVLGEIRARTRARQRTAPRPDTPG